MLLSNCMSVELEVASKVVVISSWTLDVIIESDFVTGSTEEEDANGDVDGDVVGDDVLAVDVKELVAVVVGDVVGEVVAVDR